MLSLQSFVFILIFVVLAFDVCESQDCSSPFKTITVSKSGETNFKTIQSAIDSVPEGNSQWIHIQISSGVYRYISPFQQIYITCLLYIDLFLKFKSNFIYLWSTFRLNKTTFPRETRELTFKNARHQSNFFINIVIIHIFYYRLV